MKSFKYLFSLALLGISVASCKKSNTTSAPVDYHQTAVTKFVVVNETKYAYRELGDKSGIPVVMVAPLGGAMDDWDPAITNGLAQKYKVILFNLPGVGSSGGNTPTTIADMATSTTAFIKALGYNKVNLLGFSLGSFISQQIALTQPALVNKIMLTGTGPKGATGLSNLPNLLAAGASLSPEDGFLKFGFASSDASIAAGKESWDRIQRRTQDRDVPVNQASAGAQVQAVLGWAQPAPDALNELKSIKQPVLIAQGEEDVAVPVINAKNMAQSLPNARLIVYSDSGHAAMFQNWDVFIKAALTFLA